MKRIKERWKSRKQLGIFSPGVLLSLGVCFMLFLFAPLEIYLNNQSDFWYDFYFILPWYLCVFAIAYLGSLILFAILWILGDRIYDLGLAGYFVLFAGCYYQGNFQTKTLPALDGTEINMAGHINDVRLSCVVWAAAFLVAMVLFFRLRRDRFRGLMKGVGGFAFAMLFLTMVMLFFMQKGYRQADYLTCSKDGMFEMSRDKNFVIFILDAVDAGTMEKVAQKHPEYQAALRDFTYYSNTMSGYPCTDCAVPLALTGEWFENKELYQNYVNRVFSENSFFAEMEESGYELALYDTEIRLPESLFGEEFKNMIHSDISVSDPALFLKRQMKLIGFKYGPWLMKPYCWFDAHKLWNHRNIDYAAGKEVFLWDDSVFYEDMKRYPVTYAEDAQFKMIHLEGAHSPFVYDAQLNVFEKTDYESCVEASMTVLMTYLDKLREAEVYDNSVIVVMADHGLGESREYDMFGRQHPILFIKGFEEGHELRTNDAPIAQEDLVGAYEKLLAGADSGDVFDWKEGDQRVRRYLYYKVYSMDHMDEYIQKGHARDMHTMELTGVEYNQ